MGGILDALTRKQQKPRGYNYKPRYYNAEKAEFKAYVERLRAERDAMDRGEYVRKDFKGAFTSQVGKKSSYQRQIAMYNLRLLIILIGICIGAYYLFQTGLINSAFDKFFDVFSKKDGLY